MGQYGNINTNWYAASVGETEHLTFTGTPTRWVSPCEHHGLGLVGEPQYGVAGDCAADDAAAVAPQTAKAIILTAARRPLWPLRLLARFGGGWLGPLP
jgi:hypothetical protein